MSPFSASNTAIILEKRSQRAQALVNVSTTTTEEQSTYLKATATEIVSRIGNGEWTATQVLEAFISRAAYAQERTNCLTEVMLESARQRAHDLDAEFAATKRLTGPLHGIPVSIKDQYDIEGVDASIGFSQWVNKSSTQNADVIKRLLEAGAIPFVKTNVPQTMFAFECSNPVFGRTTNPYNDAYTSGGSSGGEGALLAMDGSALGIGSDIGGSLRIPAAYCGIYTLKPAAGRFPFYGAKSSVSGFQGIMATGGAMTRSVKDLELVYRATFGPPSTDQNIAPLPYREVELPKKLKFGYYTSDGYIKASPACQRAVLETVDALRNAGHECVEFDVPEVAGLFNTFGALTASDGYKTLLSHLGPDRKENALFLITTGAKLPSFARTFAAWVIERFIGDKIFSQTLRSLKPRTVTDYWKLTAKKDQYVRDFNKTVWDGYGFDSIIAPVQALPQLPHGGCDNFTALAVGTAFYNALDMPAGCFPVSRVDPIKDQMTDEWLSGPGRGSSLLESGIYTHKTPLYNPEAMKGMPISVQVVGRKWEEEKVIAIMQVIDDALGERGFGPGAWDKHMEKAQ